MGTKDRAEGSADLNMMVLGFRVLGLGFRVLGFRFLGLRVSGFRHQLPYSHFGGLQL